jgi:hypothetical protein
MTRCRECLSCGAEIAVPGYGVARPLDADGGPHVCSLPALPRCDQRWFWEHRDELEAVTGIRPRVEDPDVYGTCPDCGQYRELSGCHECPQPKLCLNCYRDHRELKHGDRPKAAEEDKSKRGGIAL